MTLAEWLKANHYRTSTIRGTLRGVRAAQDAFNEGRAMPETSVPAAGRLLLFAEANPRAKEFDEDFIAWVQTRDGVKQVKKTPNVAPKRRVRKAVSLDPKRWKRLREKLEKGEEPEDLVILIMLRTALRIGDVLRIPRAELEKGYQAGVFDLERKGGTFVQVEVGDDREAWRALRDGVKKRGAANVAEFVCRKNASPEPGDCAYMRIYRRLKEYQDTLQCEDSLHPHRLRRTLAVRTLEANGDLQLVQQLLHHVDIRSTMRYTDERRLDAVAAAKRKALGE